MLDYQTVLLVLGLIALLGVMFMVLVRPGAKSRYRRQGLGQTGRPGSVKRQREPQPAPASKPDEAAPRESKSA